LATPVETPFTVQPDARVARDHAGRTFVTVDALGGALRGEKRIADRGLATTLFLTLTTCGKGVRS